MCDLLVTTPKGEMANSAREAEDVKRTGGGLYFRWFQCRPQGLGKGSRVFYCEDGYVRGYAIVRDVQDSAGRSVCATTGRVWHGQVKVVMDAKTWTWIQPIPMRGFQNYRLVPPEFQWQEVGGWLDPKPEVIE